MGGKLEAIDDVEQARAIGQSKDVEGQREASEEGEDEFHGLWEGKHLGGLFRIRQAPFRKEDCHPKAVARSALGYPFRPLWLALGGPLTAGA